ncbi:hypothetical protein DVK02_18065, partial [Halobellus sp. Atlit-31R]
AGSLGQWIQNIGISGDMTSGAAFTSAVIWIVALFLIATMMPNSLEIMQRYQPALYFEPKAKLPVEATPSDMSMGRPLVLTWNTRWAFVMAALFIFGTLGLSRPSEFLYWQF